MRLSTGETYDCAGCFLWGYDGVARQPSLIQDHTRCHRPEGQCEQADTPIDRPVHSP